MDIKKIITTTFKGLVLLLAFLFILSKCTSCGDIEVKYDNKKVDSLNNKIKQDSLRVVNLEHKLVIFEEKAAKSEMKADSLMNQKKIEERKYRNMVASLREDLLKGKCDTFAILTVLNQCDSTIEADNRVIASKDSVIANKDSVISVVKEENTVLKGMVDTSREVIKEKDNNITELENTLKKTKRRNKIKTALIIIADVIKDGLLIFALK